MKELIELKEALLNISLSSCNVIQYANSELQDELVKNLIKRCNEYSDEERKFKLSYV